MNIFFLAFPCHSNFPRPGHRLDYIHYHPNQLWFFLTTELFVFLIMDLAGNIDRSNFPIIMKKPISFLGTKFLRIVCLICSIKVSNYGVLSNYDLEKKDFWLSISVCVFCIGILIRWKCQRFQLGLIFFYIRNYMHLKFWASFPSRPQLTAFCFSDCLGKFICVVLHMGFMMGPPCHHFHSVIFRHIQFNIPSKVPGGFFEMLSCESFICRNIRNSESSLLFLTSASWSAENSWKNRLIFFSCGNQT